MKYSCNNPETFPIRRGCRLAVLVALGASCSWAQDVDSSAALFDDAVVHQYKIDFYRADWKETLAAMWVADSGYLPARFSDGTITLDSVGVRFKGNSSYTLAGNNPKKPLKIKFNEFKDLTYRGIKVLNFSNGIGDPTMMREHISYAIARKYLPAPRSSFVHITVNGAAMGLYTQVEQADKTFLKRWYTDAKGTLFKAGDDGATLAWIDDKAASYANSGAYELKTNDNSETWKGFVGFVDFLNRSTDDAFCADRSAYFGDDNVAKFLAFNTVLSNFDSYNGSGRNWYMYQPDTATPFMSMIPWDLNLSFGAYGGASGAVNISIDTTQAPIASRPLFRRFVECAATRTVYHRWLQDMIANGVSTDSVTAAVVRDSALIAPFVAADSNKFYTAAAWKTNLRANYRGSEGVILGLVSFSQSRNAAIATQLGSIIAVAPGVASRTWGVVRSGDAWSVTGLETLGAGTIRWASIDGRNGASIDFRAGTNRLSLPLPSGLVAVSVRTSRGIQSILLHNTRK
jgi:spore coat protein CotH